MKLFQLLLWRAMPLGVWGLVLPLAYGQENTSDERDAQRAAINSTRITHTQRLDDAARACDKKFAVTRCLDQVQTERLELERDLNRQDAALNEVQRRQQGLEQEARQRDKIAAHEAKIAQAVSKLEPQIRISKHAPQPTGGIRQQSQGDSKDAVLSVQERTAHAQNYHRKQKDAAEKRAEVERRLNEAGPKKPGLPPG